MSKLVLLSPIFFLLIFHSAFADSNQSQFNIKDPTEQILELITNFTEVQVQSSPLLDQEKKDAINKALDSGLSAQKTSISLWDDVHQFIIDTIFAGSPIRFDHGIIILIAFVISTVLLFTVFLAFIRKFWKIAIVVIAIIAVVLIFGIEFPTLS